MVGLTGPRRARSIIHRARVEAPALFSVESISKMFLASVLTRSRTNWGLAPPAPSFHARLMLWLRHRVPLRWFG